MRLVKLTCPQCAAVVDANEAGETARCGYCGTVSRVQRRTGILQRPMPLGQAPADVARLPVATQAYSRRFKLSLLAVPLGIGVVGALIAVRRFRWDPRPE